MLSAPELDAILSLQLAVAWAGEAADEDERRLGWWKTDLVSQFGGIALFERLAPRTAAWAVYESAREAATRVDAEQRSADAAPDELGSLFHFGFTIDEQLGDRLLTLKQGELGPREALPSLAELPETWAAASFGEWLAERSEGAEAKTEREPSGLRVVKPPEHPLARARSFAAVLSASTEADRYPCPHVREAHAPSPR